MGCTNSLDHIRSGWSMNLWHITTMTDPIVLTITYRQCSLKKYELIKLRKLKRV